jgi:hypothetical protein
MIIESQIRKEIARVLSKEVSLNDLYRWLMARNWNMDRDSKDSAVDLASEVEMLFIERSSGDRSDSEVLQALGALVNPPIVVACDAVPMQVRVEHDSLVEVILANLPGVALFPRGLRQHGVSFGSWGSPQAPARLRATTV